jgi:hypothetical protein
MLDRFCCRKEAEEFRDFAAGGFNMWDMARSMSVTLGWPVYSFIWS